MVIARQRRVVLRYEVECSNAEGLYRVLELIVVLDIPVYSLPVNFKAKGLKRAVVRPAVELFRL
jgi:hypothetical protein